jgi:hypothetical protein
MKRKTSALLSLGLCVVLAVVALSMVSGRHDSAKEPETAVIYVTSAPAETQAPEDTGEEGEEKSGLLARLFQKATPTPEPTATPSPTPRSAAALSTDPIVTERSIEAPSDYFEDAAFVGDAMVMGLDMYDYDEVLEGADFYAADGVTVLNVSSHIKEMEGQTYGKIYVGLGIDELNQEQDTLRSCFNNMIDTLRDYDPGCIIYLMSVTPVSEYKSSTSSSYNQELILAFNAMLQQIAEDQGVYYLDVYSALCNSDGYLPSDVTVDGIHFTPAHYGYWLDYLQTHYVGGSDAVTTEDDSADTLPVESAPAGEK